ncbi:unnamed protein product [Brassica oleracea var. botrytis]
MFRGIVDFVKPIIVSCFGYWLKKTVHSGKSFLTRVQKKQN